MACALGSSSTGVSTLVRDYPDPSYRAFRTLEEASAWFWAHEAEMVGGTEEEAQEALKAEEPPASSEPGDDDREDVED
ncbi:hypothetical protein BV25DRAFT_1922065, partial [Artomyces pyxidatus]